MQNRELMVEYPQIVSAREVISEHVVLAVAVIPLLSKSTGTAVLHLREKDAGHTELPLKREGLF